MSSPLGGGWEATEYQYEKSKYFSTMKEEPKEGKYVELQKARKKSKPTRIPPGGEGLPPPSERISIYGNVYPDSVEEQWCYHPDGIWVWGAESITFREEWGMCEVAKTFHKFSFLSRTEDGYVNNREIKEGRWVVCAYTSRALKAGDMVEAVDGKGGKIMISPRAAKSAFFRDEIDGKLHSSKEKINITRPIKYVCVSSFSVTSGKAKIDSCPGCGHYFDNPEEVMLRPELTTAVCSRCYNIEITRHAIKAFNFKGYPPPIHTERLVWLIEDKAKGIAKRVPDPRERLFGVEAEVEVLGVEKDPSLRAKMAVNAMRSLGNNFVVIKHDGSLGNNGLNGFEIVTGPCDLAAHRAKWPLLEKMDGIGTLRAWDTETCGMHVHASKSNLTTLQVGRLLTFINAPENKRFVEAVAGRSATKYCRLLKKKLSDSLHPEQGGYDETRRVAINVQNKETIEFRIFRGTARPKHILRNLEFCDAIISFCLPGDRSFRELTDYLAFIQFCSGRRKEWPLFNEWLEFHDLARKRKMAPGKTAGEIEEAGTPLTKLAEPRRKSFKEKALEAAEASDPDQF